MLRPSRQEGDVDASRIPAISCGAALTALPTVAAPAAGSHARLTALAAYTAFSTVTPSAAREVKSPGAPEKPNVRRADPNVDPVATLSAIAPRFPNASDPARRTRLAARAILSVKPGLAPTDHPDVPSDSKLQRIQCKATKTRRKSNNRIAVQHDPLIRKDTPVHQQFSAGRDNQLFPINARRILQVLERRPIRGFALVKRSEVIQRS